MRHVGRSLLDYSDQDHDDLDRVMCHYLIGHDLNKGVDQTWNMGLGITNMATIKIVPCVDDWFAAMERKN